MWQHSSLASHPTVFPIYKSKGEFKPFTTWYAAILSFHAHTIYIAFMKK
jgi:hypothetical protein